MFRDNRLEAKKVNYVNDNKCLPRGSQKCLDQTQEPDIPFCDWYERKNESYNKYLLVVFGSQLKVLVHLQRNRKEEEIDAIVRTYFFLQNHERTKFPTDIDLPRLPLRSA